MSDTTNPKDIIGQTKPPIHLVPPQGLIWMAKAMENGAQRYGPYNWRDKKVRATVYISAAMRHLLAYLDGEELAQDSKVHHLGHAAACMAILLDAKENDCLIDDRPKSGNTPELLKRLTIDTKASNPVT